MTTRITVIRGRLLRATDAAPLEGLASQCYGYSFPTAFEYQLTAIEDGTPATADYRGPGTVTTSPDGRTILILGDPTTQAWLPEYVVAEKATPESQRNFDEQRAGFTAGALGKRKRPNVDPLGGWMEGYEEGRRQRSQRGL